MYVVIISTVSTGRVIRRSFERRRDAEAFAAHAEGVLIKLRRAGLRGVRIEIARNSQSPAAAVAAGN